MKRFDQTALVQFHQLVSSHIGLNIRKEDRASFSRLLAERIQSAKCDEADGYFSLLESDTRASRLEWKELIARLTTGESYFFRDKGHFFLLQNIILPELIKTRRSCRTLRIWSAGCSTGEEPYSIAILLGRFFPGLRDWEVLILGTDINERFLEKARRGIYTDWSFRRMDGEVQRQYFVRDKDLWRIDSRISGMVTFRHGNLVAEELSGSNSEIRDMDLILCRNVFIYLKSEMVSGIIDRCIPILKEGGYPQGLKGDEILIEARVLAVADVVEAMASHRPYRASLGIDAAIGEIDKNRGVLYDDAVVDACLRLFKDKGYKLGT